MGLGRYFWIVFWTQIRTCKIPLYFSPIEHFCLLLLKTFFDSLSQRMYNIKTGNFFVHSRCWASHLRTNVYTCLPLYLSPHLYGSSFDSFFSVIITSVHFVYNISVGFIEYQDLKFFTFTLEKNLKFLCS